MTMQRAGWASLARWTGCLLVGGLAGAVLGAVVGMCIGDSLGSPEGEGFIGFILGMRFGAVLGLIPGAWLARRLRPDWRRTPQPP